MSTILEYIQYDEIMSLLNELKTAVSKEAKQDQVLSQLSTISSKLDQILAALGVPRATYSVVLTGSSVAANKHHLIVFNSSTVPIRIIRIILHAEVTATVTGFQMSYRVHRISSYTGGTPLSIVKFDTTDPDVNAVTAVTNPTAATVTATLMSLCVNPEETGGNAIIDIDFIKSGVKPIILQQNQGISIQQYGTAGTGTLSATVIFTT